MMIAWIRRWGWFLGFAIGALVTAVFTLGRRKTNVAAELRGVRAEARAEKLEARLGHQAAVQAIEAEYRSTIETMETSQKIEAIGLRDDPQALARFLAQAGRSKT